MTFAWASQNPALRQIDLPTLQQRFNQSGLHCRYYNPAIHVGSFAPAAIFAQCPERNTLSEKIKEVAQIA